jgi:G3E family GTPase
MPDTRIPVTILTGFLGSGKTTLLNRLLREQHGKRIAVIENEFGEIGIDQELVVRSDEEIFEMNNGCICCTVRGDLIRILGNLMKRKDRFDYVLIETTGLADPGPVAQTFLMDDDMREYLRLDGIVTLVDAHHVLHHLADSEEVQKQIAFADLILINKSDLEPASALDALEKRIRHMNIQARIERTIQASIPVERVLNTGAFDVKRALQTDPRFLEPEYPFEWGGLYTLTAGTYTLTFSDGPDPSMRVSLLPAGGITQTDLDKARDRAVRIFGRRHEAVESPETLVPGIHLYELAIGSNGRSYSVEVEHDGVFALFTQHHPDEFAMKCISLREECSPALEAIYKPDHEHDDEVTSVGIRLAGDLHMDRLNEWMRELLATKGPDIYRSKGVLSIRHMPNRIVFQGVHMLFDFQPERPWGADPRVNTLVFIGRNLDRRELTEGVQSCLA